MHTENVSPRKTGKGAEWGLGIRAVVGILSGGVTLIGGALVGAAAGAKVALSHKGVGLTDDDKTKLEDHLQDGGAALVAMASDDEVQAVKGFLNNLNVGEVQDYQVPADTVQKLDDEKCPSARCQLALNWTATSFVCGGLDMSPPPHTTQWNNRQDDNGTLSTSKPMCFSIPGKTGATVFASISEMVVVLAGRG